MSNIINPITVNDEALRDAVVSIVEDLLPDLVAREVAKLNHPSNGEPETEPYVFKVGDRVRLEAGQALWCDGQRSFVKDLGRGALGTIDSPVYPDGDISVDWDGKSKGCVNPDLLSLVDPKADLEVGKTYLVGPDPHFFIDGERREHSALRSGTKLELIRLRPASNLCDAKDNWYSNVVVEGGWVIDPACLLPVPEAETVWIHAHDYQSLPAWGPDRWIGEDIVYPLVADEFYQVNPASVEKLGEFKPSGRKPKVGDRIRLLVEHPNRQYPAAPAGVTATVVIVDGAWFGGKCSIEHDLVDGRRAPYAGANLLARDEFTILVTS